MFELQSARYIAASAMNSLLLPGDRVIDATMGNGHDTLMLAQLVGVSGHVDAFDVQPSALSATKERLMASGAISQCTLHLLGHENMAQVVQAPVKAVLFNLGWLPGSDKSITTLWNTTRQAVKSALELLAPMGVVSICMYPGHEAGDFERQNLLDYVSRLRPQQYNVLHHRFLNAGAFAPECILIQRQK